MPLIIFIGLTIWSFVLGSGAAFLWLMCDIFSLIFMAMVGFTPVFDPEILDWGTICKRKLMHELYQRSLANTQKQDE